VPPVRSAGKHTHAIALYTDGSASPNPGPGGWAAILVEAGARRNLSGHEARTTNNRMELRAAIEGLRAVPRSARVRLHTDSQYVRLGITSYLPSWRANGWKTRARQPVANQDLWQALDETLQGREVTWVWVRGHAGHALNEAADRLARHAIPKVKAKPRPAPHEPEACQAYLAVSATPSHARWAIILASAGREESFEGEVRGATANALILHAAVQALRRSPKQSALTISAGARYLVDGASHSLVRWRANGWRTAAGAPVQNKPLWEEIARLSEGRNVRWEWKNASPLQAGAEALAAGRRGKSPAGPA
jgi:ribonuclease HI